MVKRFFKLLPLLIVIAVLITLAMVFLPALTNNDDKIMNGLKAVFGGNVAAVGSFASADIKFSFLNLLAYFLPAFLSLGFMMHVYKTKKSSRLKLIMTIFVLAGFITSTILLSSLGANTVGAIKVLGVTSEFTYKNANLGIGATIAMITSIIGAVLTALFLVLDFLLPNKKKR